MKLSELKAKLKLSDSDIDNLEVDSERAIIDQEFNRKPRGHLAELPDYRLRAIDRLVDLCLDFSSEANIFGDLAKRVITLKCPDCQSQVEIKGSGGAFSGPISGMHISGSCETCKITVSLTMPANGIQISFKE